MHRLLRASILPLLVGAGCDPAGPDGGDTAACHDYTGFDGESSPAGFRTDVLPVLQRSCGLSSSCHGDENAAVPGQPYLGPPATDSATDAQITAILDGIVGVAASAEPGLSIVEAGDPENSFLMHKVDGTLGCDVLACAADGTCGDSMPYGSDRLGESERDALRRWLAQGAQNN